MVGKTLGHYEILEPLGAGGMGEVYRARDTKLDRDVAIKVLPEDFATDPERLARFEREAKLLASLNHANIAAIYGLEDEGDQRFIVMEVVEGETLAERIASSGRIEVEEALEIARQIAEALEAAHENGVIHRDLKPANVIVTPDGKVKVLDFGLAKAWEADGSSSRESPDLSHSPTMMGATRTGVIMGTAAYMSPEQAKGKPLDKRTDIWSFGALLFEMLTGRSAFGGEDVSETLAAILKDEPDWSALPDGLPVSLPRLLRRCLAKDAPGRLRDVGDARLEINETRREAHDDVPDPAEVAVGFRFGATQWISAALVGVLAATIAWTFRGPVVPPLLSRLVIPPRRGPGGPPQRGQFRRGVSRRKGGRVCGQRGRRRTALSQVSRRVRRSAARRHRRCAEPVLFSQWGVDRVFAANQIWKMRLSGGQPFPVCRTSMLFASAAWGPDDTIVFAHFSLGLWEVSAEGGEDPHPITVPDTAAGEVYHGAPQFLPDGRVLFTIQTNDAPRAAVLSLDSRTWEVVADDAEGARYVESGHLVYARSADLTAVSFDASTLAAGSPTSLSQTVTHVPWFGPHFAVSENGTLVYAPADAMVGSSLVWVDRDGAAETIRDEKAYFSFPRVSPDGQQIAVTKLGGVWVYDAVGGRGGIPLAGGGYDLEPIWSSDGSELIFTANKPDVDFDLFRVPADGSGPPRLVLEREGRLFASSWSPDGLLAFYEVADNTNVLVLDGEEVVSVLASQNDEHTPMFHPQGRWIAYASSETGTEEVWLTEYPGSGRKWKVSDGGGGQPLWSPSGDELFYRSGDAVFAVPFDATSGLTTGTPEELFTGRYFNGNEGGGLGYDIHPEGERFLMLQLPEAGPPQINVVQNWFEELKRLVPTGRNP